MDAHKILLRCVSNCIVGAFGRLESGEYSTLMQSLAVEMTYTLTHPAFKNTHTMGECHWRLFSPCTRPTALTTCKHETSNIPIDESNFRMGYV